MDRRAELKLWYKQNPPPMGVFQIMNNANGKRYVARALDLPGIINRHKFELRMGSHRSRDLQRDWFAYGEDGFTFEILEVLKPGDGLDRDYPEDLKILEELWLEKLQPYGEKGYNQHTPTRS